MFEKKATKPKDPKKAAVDPFGYFECGKTQLLNAPA